MQESSFRTTMMFALDVKANVCGPGPDPIPCEDAVCSQYDGKGARCIHPRFGKPYGCLFDKVSRTCACPPYVPTCDASKCSAFDRKGGQCKRYGAAFGCEWNRATKTCACAA